MSLNPRQILYVYVLVVLGIIAGIVIGATCYGPSVPTTVTKWHVCFYDKDGCPTGFVVAEPVEAARKESK
jgi:hypothetical protein